MEKKETLKDGTKILIRELHVNDLDKLMKFYSILPLEDQKYLRIDVTDKKVVEQRIELTKAGNVFRLIALFEDEIIADGALELSGEEWRKHQGELRVIVARPFQQKGLGMILVREMYFLAVEKKVEQVIVKMMRPQIAAQRIFRKLGFREELLIPDYVQDRGGKKQDLIIMVCDTKDLWNELEHFYGDSDWQRCR
ncbi:MAG: GNAT family N-acetyltransferase [Candidatus Aminicenantes bacterium]|nr:GNAT family N-acetyltransferase [Candidatus Aminicenantes bacterium]